MGKIALLIIAVLCAILANAVGKGMKKQDGHNGLLHHPRSVSSPSHFQGEKDLVMRGGSEPAPKPASVMTTLPPIALAAFCTAAIMYPLDLIRALKMASATEKLTTLQLLSNFKDTHGVKGFFTQGLVPEVARAFWMRSLKFFLYPVMHEAVAGAPPSRGTVPTKALAGVLASVPECLSIMPLEIAKVLLQLDTEKALGNSMLRAMRAAVAQCGPAGLFTGYVGVQYRQASWTAAYFASIDIFRQIVTTAANRLGATKPGPLALNLISLISGFFAGVLGAIFNTPGDVVRTNIQKSVLKAGGDCSMPAGLAILTAGPVNFIQAAGTIVDSRGVGALWAGFGFKALHLGGSGALMALLIGFFKSLLGVKYS